MSQTPPWHCLVSLMLQLAEGAASHPHCHLTLCEGPGVWCVQCPSQAGPSRHPCPSRRRQILRVTSGLSLFLCEALPA